MKWPIGDFELRIGVFQNHQVVILSQIGHFKKHQSPIQNHQLAILSPTGDFNFYFSNIKMPILWSQLKKKNGISDDQKLVLIVAQGWSKNFLLWNIYWNKLTGTHTLVLIKDKQVSPQLNPRNTLITASVIIIMIRYHHITDSRTSQKNPSWTPPRIINCLGISTF